MTHVQHRTLPSEAQMRAAIAARDRGFNGTFFYGVITTGVFCLPSCAARAARAENVRFFFDAEDAVRSGLRACKRCRPLDALQEREQLIAIARHIEANASEHFSIATLANRAGMTPGRFQKAFKATLGVTARAYQDGARLKGFKSSLQEGRPVTAAIFDAGYGSTSRLYGVAARNIGMTPRAYRAGGAGETIHYACRDTALGSLLMAATARGVCFVQFGESAAALRAELGEEFPAADIVPSGQHDSAQLDAWILALDDHLARSAPRPDLPLDLRGTAFQIKVWRFLLRVAEGDVISYSELAVGIEQPKAVRAAASACGANRIAVLIPCHRVLRGNGELGGYRWGVDRKRALLDAERARAAAGRTATT